MKDYIFIHGKNSSLSLQEMRAVFNENLIFQNILFSVVHSSEKVDQAMMNRLGGIIKICEVFSEDPVEVIIRNSKTTKIVFGLSQYGGHERLSEPLAGLKNKIKAKGRNTRFLNKNFSNISSGQLNKSKILEKGVDIIRCFFEGKEVWARTIAFQDIDSYSLRDYEKPKRDMKVGMMPPKLAQMMINYSEAKMGGTIYDPFCGLGGILMEAVLMNFEVMGSDIKGRLIDSTTKNLDWLKQNYQLPATSYQLFQHDATQQFPPKKFPNNVTVVTEAYLGPPMLKYPPAEKQKEVFELLHGINQNFLTNISEVIKSGNRIVMCFPFYRSGDKKDFYAEEYLREYESLGFAIQNELRSLLYERQNQVVGREIIIFERV